MSAPSGIKVPPSLASSFHTALNDSSNVRALVFIIEGETFNHLTTVNVKGSFKDDIELLAPTLPSKKTPASFAYRLDSKEGGKHEWMMITFVPDDAGVRAKMLQASSRAGLMKALGAGNFKHDWFATQASDLTPSSLTSHLNHMSSPPPLSASEAALAEVREAEALEAKRAALDPDTEARRRKAVVGLSGKMQWQDGVDEAMRKVAERSDDGWIVTLEIPATNAGAVALLKSEACKPSELASKLPEKSPCYTFYSFPTPAPAAAPKQASTASTTSMASARNTFQASEGGIRSVASGSAAAPKVAEPEEMEKKGAEDVDEGDVPVVEDLKIEEPSPEPSVAAAPAAKGRVLFLYTCPSGSPIKFRMVYSSSVRGVQQDAVDKAGVQIAGKASLDPALLIETSDLADLTESYLKSNLEPAKPTHSASLPTPARAAFASSAAAPSFGGAFGRPRPTPSPKPTLESASQVPLPPSEPATPISGGADDGDSKDNIKRAFDAFGPRVNSGSGGGFARPRPAGRR